MHLSHEISHDIHKETFKKFKFFKEIGDRNFLGWLGSRLKPILLTEK